MTVEIISRSVSLHESTRQSKGPGGERTHDPWICVIFGTYWASGSGIHEFKKSKQCGMLNSETSFMTSSRTLVKSV